MNQPGSSLILTAPRKSLLAWGLRDGASVPLVCGKLQGIAEIKQSAQQEQTTSLRWAGGRLDLQIQGVAGQIVYSQAEGLRIGPVIGIMTTGVRRDIKKPIGGRTSLLGDFVRASRELNVLCYVFNAADVNFSAGTVSGVTMTGPPGRETWTFGRFPLPEVVYNRVPHRRAETLPDVKRCKERLERMGVPMFNERFLNKNEMYRWLSGDKRSSTYIPETERMRTADGLQRFCLKHQLIYLKPTGGSLGMGIYQVERDKQGYLVRYKREKNHVTTRFVNAEAVLQFVRRRSHPKSTYLMQQGIRMMEYQGRKTDFRVHLHKNSVGAWEAAGIGAKVAGSTSVTTHVHNGGRVVAGDKVLRAWYGERAEQMKARIVEVSIRVADVIQGLLKGESGEFGLDVALDKDGQVWVFETNAKPGRAVFRHTELIEAGKRSARMVLEYGAYLSKFPLNRGGGVDEPKRLDPHRSAR
ncbi:hypothetical protein CIG75_11480 [Tumebacillus algifaecis]|uniref:ATP-grasp domain-containing protein n=1 Tax=Tumebacillus algifaecis TaxID=1214604 RepID=A0A223D242_9BACL|nr:YheC/YheD family protein [Tumebacillus algifaecis]ASS75545.1 hypothetical protein CIG75_11480 [Tumebacillus algifaecis]